MKEHNTDGIKYLTFESLDNLGLVMNAFSTRIGGVSEGYYSSMNLGFTNGDREEDVYSNYERMARVLHVDLDHIVMSKQTHTTNVRLVDESNCYDDGCLHKTAFTDVDGMVTNTPGVCLCTFYADCVPLYFVDPVNKAIGLSHSGWRGTVKRMGKVTIEAMKNNFGSKPEDIYAAIGPSICRDCYEVSKDVADEFVSEFGELHGRIVTPGINDQKFQLNLIEANKSIMIDAGIKPEHIELSNICTCENSDLLFSHRASKGKRGNLAAFLMLNRNV